MPTWPARLAVAEVSGEPETPLRHSLRAAAQVMRATAERMEAILTHVSLSDEAVLARLAADVEVFCAAMETIERELSSPP